MAENGRLPKSDLAGTYLYYPGTVNGRDLLKGAADNAEALATAFLKEFRRPLEATDGYRSLGDQHELYERLGPGLAAKPGTSNHGWGKALDLASNINRFGSPEHKWMQENARRFGWEHPHWARQGGGREEAWHWEFVGGGKSTPRIERPAGGSVGLGMSGKNVREVQELLNKKVHEKYRLKVDGDYGLMTGLACIKFQESRGLKEDGKVGKATRAELHGRRADPLPAPKPGRGGLKDDGVWGEATTRRLQEVLGVKPRDGIISAQPVAHKDVLGKSLGTGWRFQDRYSTRGSKTIATLQLRLGVGLTDGIFGEQSARALRRHYRTNSTHIAIQRLQRALNKGRI